MSINLKLPSGLCLRNAPIMLHKKFEQWPYERYDGDFPANPNVIGEADIERVYQLGARTPKQAYRSLCHSEGARLTLLLRKLPGGARIESTNLDRHRDTLVELLDLTLSTKGIKLAGATKLLSPFRPGLIPVVDSVIEEYYWYATSIGDTARFRKLEASFKSGSWGEYIFEILKLMKDDVRRARADIDRVLTAARPAPYSNISRVRAVESLIWYYYARGDA
jgi:hypothetical protein